MTLIRFLRTFGMRDGFALWRTRVSLRSDRRLAQARPAFDRHHGRRPDMPGYRRTQQQRRH